MNVKSRMAEMGITQVDMILELQKRGIAVQPPKKRVQNSSVCSEGVTRSVYERELERDRIILAGLQCAKANGFCGEDLV